MANKNYLDSLTTQSKLFISSYPYVYCFHIQNLLYDCDLAFASVCYALGQSHKFIFRDLVKLSIILIVCLI